MNMSLDRPIAQIPEWKTHLHRVLTRRSGSYSAIGFDEISKEYYLRDMGSSAPPLSMCMLGNIDFPFARSTELSPLLDDLYGPTMARHCEEIIKMRDDISAPLPDLVVPMWRTDALGSGKQSKGPQSDSEKRDLALESLMKCWELTFSSRTTGS